MNFQEYIKTALLRDGKVEIPGFGTFSFKNSGAVYNSDGTISPPSKTVFFSANHLAENQNFVKNFANYAQISLQESEKIATENTSFWKKKMESAESFSIEGIGDFSLLNDQISFQGNRLETQSPEYYGLEKIAVSDLAKSGKSSAWKWIFGIVTTLIISALVYFAIFSPKTIFGKKSFEDNSLKPKENLIKQNPIPAIPVKTDSVKIDSLKKDSVAKKVALATIPATKKYYPKKNFYKKSYKKSYTKKPFKTTKWKQKKRRTR